MPDLSILRLCNFGFLMSSMLFDCLLSDSQTVSSVEPTFLLLFFAFALRFSFLILALPIHRRHHHRYHNRRLHRPFCRLPNHWYAHCLNYVTVGALSLILLPPSKHWLATFLSPSDSLVSRSLWADRKAPQKCWSPSCIACVLVWEYCYVHFGVAMGTGLA